MTKEEKYLVCRKCCSEGFDYNFVDYSDWTNIKDKKFHKLREAYVKAQAALADYIDLKNFDESNYGG